MLKKSILKVPKLARGLKKRLFSNAKEKPTKGTKLLEFSQISKLKEKFQIDRNYTRGPSLKVIFSLVNTSKVIALKFIFFTFCNRTTL